MQSQLNKVTPLPVDLHTGSYASTYIICKIFVYTIGIIIQTLVFDVVRRLCYRLYMYWGIPRLRLLAFMFLELNWAAKGGYWYVRATSYVRGPAKSKQAAAAQAPRVERDGHRRADTNPPYPSHRRGNILVRYQNATAGLSRYRWAYVCDLPS